MAISRRTGLLALTLMVGVLLALPGIELLTDNERATAQVTERPKRGEGARREMSSGAHM